MNRCQNINIRQRFISISQNNLFYENHSSSKILIQYLIANRNLDQLEPVYTDKVEMTVFVPTDEMGSLRAEMMEGTNGQVVLDEETTCWFARTEDGIKIFDEE